MRRALAGFFATSLLAVGCSSGSQPPDLASTIRGIASAAGAEASDTAVRDAVAIAVYCTLVEDRELLNDYGMFTDEGDARVRSAVQRFVNEVLPGLEDASADETRRAVVGRGMGEGHPHHTIRL